MVISNLNDDARQGEGTTRACSWACISQWSTGATIFGLSGISLFLFLQLQAVTYQVASNSYKINQLQQELTEQSNKTAEVSKEVNHSLVHQMAGGFVLLTILITTFHMTAHLRSFHEPDIQRKIVAILFLPPIYTIASFVSLIVPGAEEYMMILKDFYEAYCIYQFLSFLIGVLGKGSHQDVIRLLEKQSDHLRPPYQCWRKFLENAVSGGASYREIQNLEAALDRPITVQRVKGQAVLLECQILAMQFVFVKPITAVINFVLDVVRDDSSSTQSMGSNPVGNSSRFHFLLTVHFWIVMVQNISVFLAFSGLLKFYHIVRDDLLWCQPFAKFLCIKGVVFMTFWQGLVIAIFIYFQNSDRNEKDATASMLQNLLICVEMLIFSIFHWCVFPVDEWTEGYRPKIMERPGIAFGDFVQDVSLVWSEASQGMGAQTKTRTNDFDRRQTFSETENGSKTATSEESPLLPSPKESKQIV